MRRYNTGNFHSKSGTESLYYEQSFPAEEREVRCHLVVLHDLFDYHSRYSFLTGDRRSQTTSPFYDSSVAISFLDLKGHGLSSGTRGHVDNFDDYVEDLSAFLELVEKEPPLSQVPLVLMGQGLGALVAIRYHQLNREREAHFLSGMVLINPLIKLTFQFPDWLNSLLAKLEYPLSHIKWPQSFHGSDFLGLQEQIENYDSDPLILDYLTMGSMKEIQRVSLEVSDAAYFFDFPTLFLLSGQDKLTNPSMTKLFAKGAPKEKTEVHEFFTARHDLLHESDRDKVIKDVYNWIKEHILK